MSTPKNKEYEARIEYTSRDDLTKKQLLALKDIGDASSIDHLVTADSPLVVTLHYYAVLAIHNEKNVKGDKDYRTIVLVDMDGYKYKSGSESLIRAIDDCIDDYIDLISDGEDCAIEIYKKESKNFSGKYFLTCHIV